MVAQVEHHKNVASAEMFSPVFFCSAVFVRFLCAWTAGTMDADTRLRILRKQSHQAGGEDDKDRGCVLRSLMTFLNSAMY